MTIITETGAGVTNATSYVSVETADAHFAALARSEWSEVALGLRQNALQQASVYVDHYEYPGTVTSQEQGLKWPRKGAKDTEGRIVSGLPHALRTAVLELALEFVTSPPSAFEKREIIKEKIGPVELVFSKTKSQPSFVFRLLLQIGARPQSRNLVRS